MTPSLPERPVTTTLIHRCARGPHQWWHQAVVCDFVGVAHAAELENITSLIIDLARAGFRAIAIRPAPELLTEKGARLRQVCTVAQRAGIRVLLRIPLPASSEHVNAKTFSPYEEAYASAVLETIRVALAAGADGIDLALLDSADTPVTPEEREALAALIRLAQVELADVSPSAILCAEVLTEDESSLTYHLEEEWLHHLRDRALLDSPWEAGALRSNVERALAQRDYLGHVAAWHWSRTRHVDTPGDVFDMRGIPYSSWEYASDSKRRTAMNLFALSLPGAAYMPFAFMGGRLVSSSNMFRRVWEGDKESAAEAKILRKALHIREERAMGTGSLAWVDGLEWAVDGVNVHMCAGVLVVVNTSDMRVEVPAEHRLLVSSASLDSIDGKPTVLPGNSCAWFETARIQRRPVFLND